MVSKQFQYGELKLGDEFESHDAIAMEEGIREAGKVIMTLGNHLNAKPMIDARQQAKIKKSGNESVGSSMLCRFVTIVDTVLEWLEHSGKTSNVKKHETVLRGFFHMIELGIKVNFFEILEFARSFLGGPEDPFPGQREYIVKCLTDIEEQKQRIVQSVEQVSKILVEIIDSEKVDLLKGKQFDNVVREAHVHIESCRRRLSGAEATIIELTTQMNTVKWFSRGCRVIGWSVFCYYFYRKYQDSTINLLAFFVCAVLSGLIWLSLFSGQASVFYESIPKLVYEHRLLKEQLEDLRANLKSSKDHKDGL